MDNNTYLLLQELAKQLNTTTEFLWSVLLKQAFIAGVTHVLLIVLTICFSITLYRFHKSFSDKGIYDDDDATSLIMWLLFIICVVMILWCIANTHYMLAAFFNPEYWALSEILEAIK